MFVCFSFLDCDFYFVKWIFEVCVFLFLDYSFYFMKVDNLRKESEGNWRVDFFALA